MVLTLPCVGGMSELEWLGNDEVKLEVKRPGGHGKDLGL